MTIQSCIQKLWMHTDFGDEQFRGILKYPQKHTCIYVYIFFNIDIYELTKHTFS